MSQRLKKESQGLPIDPLNYFGLLDTIDNKDKALLQQFQLFGQKHLTTQRFFDCCQKAQFPYYLLPQLQSLNVGSYFIPEPYGKEAPLLTQGLILATIGQYDLGIATFLFLQLPLAGRTVWQLGSQTHKDTFLFDLTNLKTIWGWGLTERQTGSNSTRPVTSYKRQGDHYILEGNKRWIGNGNRDFVIVYGGIGEGKQRSIIGGIVGVKQQGVSSVPIKNKLPFRIVQNCQIQLKGVRVQPGMLLPGADSYKNGVEGVLKHSRVIVIWIAVGGCLGVVKSALDYTRQRLQFGRPINSFQLIQQKLVRMMATFQAVLLTAHHITRLYQSGKASPSKVGMFKAWITERGRLISALGRQVMGGNGLLRENRAMRHLLDMQVLYTYEGTYDINVLLAGSELTGIKAFL